jgi:hypothetical protein
MSRGREDAALQYGKASARLDKKEFRLKSDPVFNPQPAVKIQKIDAAAQQNVLAVIDNFAGLAIGAGNRPGSSPPAGKRPRFEDIDAETGAPKSH